jgi:hypothetical protein
MFGRLGAADLEGAVRPVGMILLAALAAGPARGQSCTWLELAALQDCVRVSADVAEPGSTTATGSSPASFHWENRCNREVRVGYVTDTGTFSAMLPPLQSVTVPCEHCGHLQSWTAECASGLDGEPSR